MNELPKILKGRKASEVFLDYSKPFIDYAFKDKRINAKDLEYALRIPWMIWNAYVLTKHQKNSIDYLANINALIGNQPLEIKNLINLMHQRKQTAFKKYKYMMGKYKLTFDESSHEINLSIESILPPTI
jgi:hypothetical protein